MIEKAIAYKKTDKDFISSLKKLGLSDKEIKLIFKKYERKKFDDGGDGGSGGDGSSAASGESTGESTGDANDEGGTAAPGQTDSTSVGPSNEGFGIGPNDSMTNNSIGPSNEGFGIGPNDAVNPSIDSRESVLDSYLGFVEENINKPMENVKTTLETYMQQINPLDTVFGIASKIPGIGLALSAYRNSQKGVTAPDDYSQMDTSVQTSTPGQNNSGGIGTMQAYAPLYNTSTGDNTVDTMRTRLENLLRPPQPTTYGLPSINPYSNYTLLDLKNLRG